MTDYIGNIVSTLISFSRMTDSIVTDSVMTDNIVTNYIVSHSFVRGNKISL